MSDLSVFNFGPNQIRTAVLSGEVYFVGKDVAEVLGYANPQKALRDHCKASISVGVNDSFTLDPQTKIIPERDVYRLIMRSKKPEAEKFEEWVVSEVLPTIRKTGQYQITQKPAIPDFSNPAEAARAWADQYEARTNAEALITKNAPKVELAETFLASTGNVTLREASKELGCKQSALTEALQKAKLIFRNKQGSLEPYARATNRGMMILKPSIIKDTKGSGFSVTQVLITPKGMAVLHKMINTGKLQVA